MRWLLVPGFGISLCVRLAYPVLYNFDGLYGQDPYAYFDYSRQIARLFTMGVPLARFYYPIGFPLLGAFGFPLLIVAICGAATCILSGLIASEAAHRLGYPARAGWIAAIIAWLVMTISPQNVQSGSVIMSDIPALWWALLAVWATLRYERGQRIGWIMLAAMGCAFAAMTRFQYALIALPIGLYILVIWRGIRIKHAVVAALIGVIAYTPQLVMTLRTPELITDNRILWQSGNITARTFFTSDGTLSNELPNYQYYLLPVRSPYYMSAWLLPLALIGLFAAARRRIAVFLVLWFVSQYIFLAGIPVQNIRYALIAFPPVALLVGVGAAWIIQTRAKFILPIFLIPGLITMAQTTDTLMIGFIGNKNRELTILRWMQMNIPEPDATVYGLDMIPAMQHYLPYRTVQIFYETPETIAGKGSRPAYALFNVNAMETQWTGRPVAQVYQQLISWEGWTILGELNGYTLFRLE